jgi:K+-sensing histidine kinase KdpD
MRKSKKTIFSWSDIFIPRISSKSHLPRTSLDGGIGITLSQQIIAQHGSKVVVKNGSNRQASLVITLPMPHQIQEC